MRSPGFKLVWSMWLQTLGGTFHRPTRQRDIWAVPAYTFTPVNIHSPGLPACWKLDPSYVPQPQAPRCIAAETSATNHARASEALPKLVLPRNFERLTTQEQLLVMVDLERVSRGEPPVLGLSVRANLFAQQGAQRRTDPLLPPSGGGMAGVTGTWGSNYAAGISAIDANYQWMYTDGWDGKLTFNAACTGPHAAGCWGHRDNILADVSNMPCGTTTCHLIMGAGYLKDGSGQGYSSFTELFVQVSRTAPALYYTWKQALAAGAKA